MTDPKKFRLPGIKLNRLNQSVALSPRAFVNVASKLESTNSAANYDLPVNYPQILENTTKYTLPKDDGTRHSFMGTIIAQANKTMRPGHYKPIDSGRMGLTGFEIKKAFIAKSPRKTFADDVKKNFGWIPSPQNYSPDKKQHNGNLYNL